MTLDVARDELIEAVYYALREECFFPVPRPKPKAKNSIQKWIQWGAIMHLHDAIAAYDRAVQEKDKG